MREWYVSLLDRVSLNEANYVESVRIFKCMDEVSGYREVRYPKMDRVRTAVEADLTRVPSVELDIRRDVLDGLRSPTRV
jgi:hypothetical protein